MSFDLKAATQAAQSEAGREPFEFDWGGEHFSLPPMGLWPLSISATFAAYSELKPEDINPNEVVLCLRQIVGEDEWVRFSSTIPLDAMPILIEEMSKEQLGGSMPDLSERQEPVSIPT
jgi:hypothetical protein